MVSRYTTGQPIALGASRAKESLSLQEGTLRIGALPAKILPFSIT